MLTRPFSSRLRGACQRTNEAGVVGISPRALELLGIGLIALVLLGLFGRLAVDGLIAHQRDTRAFYYPLTAWFAQELDAGRLPLWCPLIFGGYPLLADGEIGMLYPANVMALLILPTERAFQFVAAIHYFVAGAGSYALARVLGVGRLAATYAGIAFALCGFMIGHFDHGNILRSAAWLPVLLCCGELALRSHGYRVIRWTALGAASLGLSGLGLHPQVVLINLVTLWSYLSMRAVALLLPLDQAGGVRGMQALLSRLIAILACTTALGLAGAAAQLIPTYELGMLSSRGDGVPYAKASSGALSPFDLVTIFLPYLFRAELQNVWSLYPYWETSLYVGVAGTMLALVGVVLGPRRVVLPLGGVALVGLALAMADYFPINVYGWLWTFPGFASMRLPSRYSLAVGLAFAVLAGIGTQRLLAQAGSRRARGVLCVVGAFALVVAGALAAVRLWIEADEPGSIQAIQSMYLALPHDRATLAAAQVRRGILAALELANPSTLLALATLLLAVALLWCWQRWPRKGRACQMAIVAVAAGELATVAHSYHPTGPIGLLTEPSGPMRFLSTRDGLWRTFIAGRSDNAVTSRPALFGVAQAYGYSSLPTERMEHYWRRVDEVHDELLDLWNSRYVVEFKHESDRIWAHDVLFDPARPLLFGLAESPIGHEVLLVAPTQADSVRLLSMTVGAAALPSGTAVAELVVSGGGAPAETLTLRLGEHTAEADFDDPARVGDRPAHARPMVGYQWTPRDAVSPAHPRNVYLADIGLSHPRTIERVEVRTIAPAGAFRLAGMALRDRLGGGNHSILTSHREKYSLVYEDEWTAIYENRAALPRAFVVNEALQTETGDRALHRLVARGFDPRRQVMLETLSSADAGPELISAFQEFGESRRLENTHSAQPSTADRAAVEHYAPDYVLIRATSAGGGHLVLTDTFYPGWHARLDGREVPIHRANYLFRSVGLPPGEHLVEFYFQPSTFYIALWVSAIAWLAMLALACSGLRGRLFPPKLQPYHRAKRT